MFAVEVAAAVGLSPLLLGQALMVRRRALRLPEAAGPRSGVTGAGPRLRLLVLGDSSAAGVGVATQSQALLGNLVGQLSADYTVHWDLIAKTGATTEDALGNLIAAPQKVYDVAVIGLGVNDVKNGVPLRKWVAHQEQLMQHLVNRHSAQRVIVSGLPPMGRFPLLPQPMRWLLGRRAQRFDQRLAGLLEDRSNCTRVHMKFFPTETPMAVDGFHPGREIYAEWAKLVANAVLENPLPLDQQGTSA